MNSERTAYHFSFVESSLSSDSTARELVVEPMAGTVPANGRWVGRGGETQRRRLHE